MPFGTIWSTMGATVRRPYRSRPTAWHGFSPGAHRACRRVRQDAFVQASLCADVDAGRPTLSGELRRKARDLITFVQRAVGYSLSGDTREECLFLLYGHGRRAAWRAVTAGVPPASLCPRRSAVQNRTFGRRRDSSSSERLPSPRTLATARSYKNAPTSVRLRAPAHAARFSCLARNAASFPRAIMIAVTASGSTVSSP